jgi:hypothetical protein
MNKDIPTGGQRPMNRSSHNVLPPWHVEGRALNSGCGDFRVRSGVHGAGLFRSCDVFVPIKRKFPDPDSSTLSLSNALFNCSSGSKGCWFLEALVDIKIFRCLSPFCKTAWYGDGTYTHPPTCFK